MTLPLDQDPITVFTNLSGTLTGVPRDGWALIRYVGQPIGEVVWVEEEGVTIGRSADNRLQLLEAEVSRHHARLDLRMGPDQETLVTLQDLGATNGTYLNGQRLEAGRVVSLQVGDVLRVSTHAFKLKHLDLLERHYHEAVAAQTTVDHLTGVSNRVTVLGYLEKHAELARRHARPLSVILCDLDHFKGINDRYGHLAGDRVLQGFGRLVSSRIRVSDQVGRIGGEEFLIVLPETPAKEAARVGEALLEALALETIDLGDDLGSVSITCSLGIAQLKAGDLNGGALLARADVALYRAKALGRNRLEFDTRA